MAHKLMLLKTLEELGEEEFRKFKWSLEQFSIPKCLLEQTNRQETVDKIVEVHSKKYVEVVIEVLKLINRNDLVEKLENTSTAAAVLPDVDVTHQTHLQSNLQDRFQCKQEGWTEKKDEKHLETLRMTNISEKYNNITSRSSWMPLGSPAVYQLKPRRKEFGSLSRLTVGEQNVNKVNKTILLVGETGAGKSTLVNTLVNYTMGVKFEDEVWYEIVEEEKKRRCYSQMSDVIVYQIFGFEGKTLPFSLTIIDTPGYGDTRGIEHDLIISQRLLELFRSDEGVHEINAVGLVLKATDNRLSERLLYVFDSVMSLFGKDIEEKIVALITHSDGLTPEITLEAFDDAKINCARIERKQPYFMFDNQQRTERTEENEPGLEFAWRVTQRGMSQFTAFLENCRPQKLMTTVEVLNERVRLTACIQNLQQRIKLIALKQAEIQQTQEALKKYKEEMKKNEEFTVEVDEAYKEKKNFRGGMWGLVFYKAAVTCNNCEENCHYPGCTMAWKPELCQMMTKGCCTVCTSKCPAAAHVKEKWIYVKKTRKVQRTEKEMKQKYEQNKAEGQKKLSLLENQEKEMKTLTEEKTQLLEDAYKHVVRLEKIALNVNSLSTHVHLDFLIEKMKEKGDREKVQKLEEMRRRVDERTRAALLYMMSKLTAAGDTDKL